MRYFILSYLEKTEGYTLGKGDLSFKLDKYPSRKYLFNLVEKVLNKKIDAIIVVNIIELSEQDYISYNS